MMRSKKNLPACRSNPENGTQGISIAARHLHEECGVFGVYAKTRCDVAGLCYYALYALQHRGQESAGIVVNDDGVFHTYRDVGLVNEVFSAERLAALGEGNIAVGHVRYGTTGSDNKRNVQPIVVNHHKGRMALAHNGNLTNSQTLRAELESRGSIFQTTSDTEVISYIIVQERLTHGSIESAVEAAMDRIQGAYSLVLSSPGKLLAVRDPHGFRPLCMGEKADGSVVFASESCALDAVGAKFVRDILPGEIVVVDKTGVKSIKSHCGKADKHLCVFEFIYFARPDSVIDGSSVQTARQRAGAYLALEHPVQADIVVGVPDSGLDAALGYARQSGIPYGIGFIKNKYIGRTFISPTQTMRENEVHIKLNPIRSVVEGKRVVLIDDSIVRGTTSRRIVKLLRDAGAKEVHMRVSAPPFVAACYYGTDIDDPKKLIANNHSIPEIAELIGVDSLGYLSLDDAVKLADNTECGFCTACFGGGYPTEVPQGGKDRFEYKISEKEQELHA
jgi:amidophosphoribosyltransferase